MKMLSENQYSDPIDISYLDGPNIKNLLDRGNSSEDAIIKTQVLSNKTQFCFKVHNHCGHLKIGKTSYFIIPKMGEPFLKTMLKAFSRPSFSTYQNNLKQDDSKSYFDELIAHLFIGSFKLNLVGRARQGYVSTSINTYKSSGKISIERSKEFFVYGSKAPTWLRNEWSKNTKFNTALRSLFLNLSRCLDVSSKTKNNLAGIGIELANEDYKGHIDYKQLLHQLDRSHTNYKPLFELAVLLNFEGGISFGESKSYSLLLPTWLLFEGACKAEIASRLPNYGINIDNKSSFTVRVSEDSGNILSPDIVIKDKIGNVVEIGDCKYVINEGCKLKRDHLFQLNTYMDGYSRPSSFILYPSKDYNTKSYKLNWGHRIDVVNLPTNSYEEFSKSLKIFLDDLLSLNLLRKTTPQIVKRAA